MLDANSYSSSDKGAFCGVTSQGFVLSALPLAAFILILLLFNKTELSMIANYSTSKKPPLKQ